MWQDKRSQELEILDHGPSAYTLQEYNQCLKYLCRINHLLGGFHASKRAFAQLKDPFHSVLEIGCGGGYFCHMLHRWFPHAKIVGVDLSEEAISHSLQNLSKAEEKFVSFEIQKNKTLEYPDNRFDVVTTMLVCHHMSDEELVVFLKESVRICKKAVIINDLQRHFLAYVSFSIIAPILFPNRLIWHDGRLSIKRALRKKEWMLLLEKAGYKKEDYTLKWNWAFRWTLTIRK